MASRTAVPCRAVTSFKSGESPGLSQHEAPARPPHTPEHKGKANAASVASPRLR
jgi:hypothetical protein